MQKIVALVVFMIITISLFSQSMGKVKSGAYIKSTDGKYLLESSDFKKCELISFDGRNWTIKNKKGLIGVVSDHDVSGDKQAGIDDYYEEMAKQREIEREQARLEKIRKDSISEARLAEKEARIKSFQTELDAKRAEYDRKLDEIKKANEEEWKQVEAGLEKIKVGISEEKMLEYMVLIPSKVNVTTGTYGTHKQYCFPDHVIKYVYTENGKVTSFQY